MIDHCPERSVRGESGFIGIAWRKNLRSLDLMLLSIGPDEQEKLAKRLVNKTGMLFTAARG